MHISSRRINSMFLALLLGVAFSTTAIHASPKNAARSPSTTFRSEGCPEGTSLAEVGDASACREELIFVSKELTLAGEWYRPRTEGTFAAVVVVRGSGDSSRGNVWTKSLVGVLVEEGLGVLVPDKRGSGHSEGDWREASFADLAGDALAAVEHVRSRVEVDPTCVGLMGLSQGGQIVPIAGARSQSVAFLINVVGAAVPFIENIRFEMLHTFREKGLPEEHMKVAMAMVATAIDYMRGSLSWSAYTASLRETREILGDEVTDAYFIDTAEHWRWDFFRRMEGFDPIDWWRRTDQPTLVLLGRADSNTDTPRTVQRLRAAFRETGRSNAQVVAFEGLGHSLWKLSGPMSEHGLHPEVRRTLASWVSRVAEECP